MEDYYSSDEEVAWGRVTLPEIKKNLMGSPKKINRRETDICHSLYVTPSTTFSEKQESGEKINTSSTTSVYFTPNVSLTRKDTFLEDLAKVIDSECSDVPNATEKIPDDTILQLLDKGAETDANILDRIQQTLIENTIMSPPQQLQSDNSVCTIEDSYYEDDSEIIVISDDSSSSSIEPEPYLSHNVCVKEEQNISNPKISKEEENNLYQSESEEEKSGDEGDLSLHEKNEEDSLDEKLEESSHPPQKLQLYDSRFAVSGLSPFKTIDSFTHPEESIRHNFEENLHRLKQMRIHQNSINKEIQNDSDSTQNTSSSSESDEQKSNSLVFNDTLEEMEMALRHGLDYQMPGDDPVPICSSSVLPETPKVTGIPVLKTRTPSTPCMTTDIKKKLAPTPSATFKLPLKPVKKSVTPNTKSPSVTSKYYKNIISPVGVYIKNNPACLMQSVATKTIPELCLSAKTPTPQKDNKENLLFPQAVYKSGRRVLTSVHRDVVLPNSIQKMTPEPILINHKARYQTPKRPQSVGRKLEEEDLTLASATFLSDSLDQDISLLTERQAFIK